MASDNLHWVRVFENLELATFGATHVIILDDVTMEKKDDESDKDWLLRNTKRYKNIANIVDMHAIKNCRVSFENNITSLTI